MCLIFFSWQSHPKYKLVMAANRDEFYARPAAKASFWQGEQQNIFAGQDLKAMGTWLGVSGSGKFGALTNYRDPELIKENMRTRGTLVSDFLLDQEILPHEYLNQKIAAETYNPFNLILGDTRSLCYYNNIDRKVVTLEPGVYGLSNAKLDSAWPKVVDGKTRLEDIVTGDAIDPALLFEMMKDRTLAPDESLPATGVPYDWEKKLSAKYIEAGNYGTRCTSVLLLDRDNHMTFIERTYPNDMSGEQGEVRQEFQF